MYVARTVTINTGTLTTEQQARLSELAGALVFAAWYPAEFRSEHQVTPEFYENAQETLAWLRKERIPHTYTPLLEWEPAEGADVSGMILELEHLDTRLTHVAGQVAALPMDEPLWDAQMDLGTAGRMVQAAGEKLRCYAKGD